MAKHALQLCGEWEWPSVKSHQPWVSQKQSLIHTSTPKHKITHRNRTPSMLRGEGEGLLRQGAEGKASIAIPHLIRAGLIPFGADKESSIRSVESTIWVLATNAPIGAWFCRVEDWQNLLVTQHAGSALSPRDLASGVDHEQNLLPRGAKFHRHKVLSSSGARRGGHRTSNRTLASIKCVGRADLG